MVKVREPSSFRVPRTQANPELLLIASSKEHDAPVFLARVWVYNDLPNATQKLQKARCTLNCHDAGAVFLGADELIKSFSLFCQSGDHGLSKTVLAKGKYG